MPSGDHAASSRHRRVRPLETDHVDAAVGEAVAGDLAASATLAGVGWSAGRDA